MATPQEDFFGGNSYPAIKFTEKSEVHKGVIIEEPKTVERKELDGPNMETQLVINLLVNDEKRTLWVKRGQMATAIREAYTEAGVKGLAEGGELGVAWISDKDVGKPSPQKIFKAKYVPPAVSAGASVDDIF